jgi:mRNA interferase MazF
MLCCPITNQVKGYPFEVQIRDNPKVSGVILSDQVKSLDWKARGAKKKGRISDDELSEVLNKLRAIFDF